MYHTVRASFRTAIPLLISVAPDGEYRQLQLRHPSLLPLLQLGLQLYFRLIPFSSTPAIHWATSGGLILPLRYEPQYLAMRQLVKDGVVDDVGMISSQKS